jgi:hypothetical protein
MTPEDEMVAMTGPQGPEFTAALWEFVADVTKGIAEPSPRDFLLACELANMASVTATLLYQAQTGCSVEEAAEHIAQMIVDKRTLYASLAASEEHPTPAASSCP